ncbi:MAG TPA: hypothetical protein ENN68_00550 [Methanomicrobia archaeon]|nr:hypothetical protein [Methanomicrobia archaeon]
MVYKRADEGRGQRAAITKNALVKRSLVAAIVLISVLTLLTTGASAAELHVGTGQTYATIQAAVDAGNQGDTIIVHDGTYNENVDVNKRLTIQSQNGSAVTTVQALGTGDVFHVTADYVNISGFTVTGASNATYAGIYLDNVSNCNIFNNIASSNNHGIRLRYSSYNNLTGNTANANNNRGILLASSTNNTLTGNTANSNNRYGIALSSSSNNNLTGNTIPYNAYGVYLSGSSSNNISCNWVHHNTARGFYLTGTSTGNTIENNNIMANGVLNETSGGYEYNFYNNMADPVEAINNYWIAIDNTTIDAGIYDDEEGKGKVTFYPFATGPVPCSPIPEAATILLFSMGVLALAGYTGMQRRQSRK